MTDTMNQLDCRINILLKFLSGAHGIINAIDLDTLDETDVENFLTGLTVISNHFIDEINGEVNLQPHKIPHKGRKQGLLKLFSSRFFKKEKQK